MSKYIKIVKRPLLICLGLALMLNAATWLVSLRFFPANQETAILHYTGTVGIDFIGAGKEINALPMIGSVLLMSNLLLAFLLYRPSRQAAIMFCAVLVPLELILFGAILLILRANV
ncbi:MAG: hypothetical protein HYZ62_00345 [Candidatus Andersenbacteria bacterium]|nr:hypothetical protein [Candidatus Andersenbacteria bacterium]